MPAVPFKWEIEAFNWIIQKQCAEESLHSFVRQGWHVVEPSHAFMDNWHIQAFCDHLEAVTDGRIKRLLFNVPPGTMKSLLVCVFWPAWTWTTKPHKRFMFSTYADALSTRDSIRCRNLIQSEWYQTRWPMIFSEDMNTKGLYKNQATGWRLASSVGGKGTGEHPNFNVFDDPHNTDPKSVESDVERQAVIDWWDGKMTTRGAIVDCAQVGVMQRVHPLDLSDHVINKGTWEVICLPMRFEPFEHAVKDGKQIKVPRMKATSLGWKDPRTTDGELLWPQAYPEAKIRDLEIDMGEHHALAQLQQRPSARGGGMFQREWFGRILTAAPGLYRIVRYWDKAGTAGGGGAQTSGVLMGLTLEIAVATGGARRRGHVVVLDCVCGRWRSADREDVIRATGELDRQRWGTAVETWIEQEPGPIWEEESIQMSDGTWRLLKNVIAGDSVINHTGTPTQVMAIHRQGKLQALKLKTRSGRSIVAAKNHPFLTPYGWRNVEQLVVGDNLALRAHSQIEHALPAPTLEECRLAGYFIGDGCMTDIKSRAVKGINRKGVLINAHITGSDDEEKLDIIKCVSTLGGQVTEVKLKKNSSVAWHCNCDHVIKQWIARRGMAGWRTESKHVPDWIASAPLEQVANFIGALLATDGGVYTANGSWDIAFFNTNSRLLQGVQSLLLRFGINSRLRQRIYEESFQSSRRIAYTLEIRNAMEDSAARFAECIPVFHSVKRKRLWEFKRKRVFDHQFICDEIISIEQAGHVECRCLTVSEGNSFLVHDTVVHNSGGKESAENTVVNMAGFICNAERVTGPKEVRAEPFASQCKVGNVSILAGDWTAGFIAELCVFPGGRLRDKGDAAGGAYNKLNAMDGVIRNADELSTKPREHEGERLIPERQRPSEFAL